MKQKIKMMLRDKKLSYSYILSFSFVIFILLQTLVYGVAINYYFLNLLQKEIDRSTRNIVQQMRTAGDSILFDISKTVYQISFDTQIFDYLNSYNYVELKKIQQKFFTFQSSDDNIYSIYLSHDETPFLLTSAGQYYKDMHPDAQWVERYDGYDSSDIMFVRRFIDDYENKNVEVLSYVRRMPIYKPDKNSSLIINIKCSEFNKLAEPFDFDETSSNYLLDCGGNIVIPLRESKKYFETEKEVALLEKIVLAKDNSTVHDKELGLLATVAYSQYNDWRYAIVQEESSGYGSSNTIRNITFVVAATYTMMVIFAARRWSKYLSKPINELADGVTETHVVANVFDEFSKIAERFTQMKSRNTNLAEIVDKTRPLVHEKVLIDILHGNEIFDESKKLIDFDFIAGKDGTISIIISDVVFAKPAFTEDQNLNIFAFRNIFNELLSAKSYSSQCARISSQQVVTVVWKSENKFNINEVLDICSHTMREMNNYFKTKIFFGIGSPCCMDSIELSSSYAEAKTAVKHARIKDRSIMYYGDVVSCQEIDYFFLISNQDMIRSYLKMGNLYKAYKVIDETKNKILCSSFKNKHLFWQAYSYILTGILMACEEMGFSYREILQEDNIYQSLSELDSVFEISRWLKGKCRQFLEYLDEKNVQSIGSKVKQIVNYMEVNIKDMSLDSLADQFSLTPSYINRLLKRFYGQTFYDLLTDMRMRTAKNKLIYTDEKVCDISFEVGYENVQSFIRLFKRMEGCSPGQFRNKKYK